MYTIIQCIVRLVSLISALIHNWNGHATFLAPTQYCLITRQNYNYYETVRDNIDRLYTAYINAFNVLVSMVILSWWSYSGSICDITKIMNTAKSLQNLSFRFYNASTFCVIKIIQIEHIIIIDHCKHWQLHLDNDLLSRWNYAYKNWQHQLIKYTCDMLVLIVIPWISSPI